MVILGLVAVSGNTSARENGTSSEIDKARPARKPPSPPTALVLLSGGGVPRTEHLQILRSAAAVVEADAETRGVRLRVKIDGFETPSREAWSTCHDGLSATGPLIDLAACVRIGRDGLGHWNAEILATPIGPLRTPSGSTITDAVQAADMETLGEMIGRVLTPHFVRWARLSRVQIIEGAERFDGHVLLDGEGRVSIGGGAFVALPHRLPITDTYEDIVVVSGHCRDAYAGAVDLSRPRRLRFECRIPDWATLGISSTRAGTEVYISTGEAGGRDWHHHLRQPNEIVFVDVPSVDIVEVTCLAEGAVPWRTVLNLRSFLAAPGKTVDVHCAPEIMSEIIYLQTDAPTTEAYLGAERIRPRIVVRKGHIGPGSPVDVLQPGTEYWFLSRRSGTVTGAAAGYAKIEHDLPPATSNRVRRVNLTFRDAALLTEKPRSTGSGVAPAREWRPGPLSLGLTGGLSYKHRRLASQLGLLAHLAPGWDNCLSLEGGLAIEQAEEPIFLSRWESETRLTRGFAALRCGLTKWPVRPFGSIGAFYSPSIAIGPWVSAGARVPLPFGDLDVVVATPIYFYDKLGHVGFESYVAYRVPLPGGR